MIMSNNAKFENETTQNKKYSFKNWKKNLLMWYNFPALM